MSNLVLPSSVTIHVVTWTGPIQAPRDTPATSRSIAVSVQTFARAKNDYHLGPFFSENGVIRITRSELERAAAVELDFGLMDYYALAECFSLVEIRAWSAAQVERALGARKAEMKQGRFFSGHDAERWGTPAAYVARLKECGNRNLKDPVLFRVRDEWDGSKRDVEYEYRVPPAATA